MCYFFSSIICIYIDMYLVLFQFFARIASTHIHVRYILNTHIDIWKYTRLTLFNKIFKNINIWIWIFHLVFVTTKIIIICYIILHKLKVYRFGKAINSSISISIHSVCCQMCFDTCAQVQFYNQIFNYCHSVVCVFIFVCVNDFFSSFFSGIDFFNRVKTVEKRTSDK